MVQRCSLRALMLAALFAATSALESTFTMVLDAGEEQCFYENVRRDLGDTILEMEFQVISGGNLDVDYSVFNPRNLIVDKGMRKLDGVFEKDEPLAGTWKFCFSNKFSTVTEKHVFFLLTIDYDRDDDDLDHDEAYETLEVSTKKIHQAFSTVKRVQSHLRARESRHRETVEFNKMQVALFSGIEMALIVIIGVIQVLVIRHFFSTDNKPRL